MKPKKYAYMTNSGAVIAIATSKAEAYRKLHKNNPNLKKSQVYRYN